METGKEIGTDDSAYWDYLKEIEESAFDGNKENEDHTFFTKFALGLNLKDQQRDIIDTFSKLIKSILKKLYVGEMFQFKNGEEECSSVKNLLKCK